MQNLVYMMLYFYFIHVENCSKTCLWEVITNLCNYNFLLTSAFWWCQHFFNCKEKKQTFLLGKTFLLGNNVCNKQIVNKNKLSQNIFSHLHISFIMVIYKALYWFLEEMLSVIITFCTKKLSMLFTNQCIADWAACFYSGV